MDIDECKELNDEFGEMDDKQNSDVENMETAANGADTLICCKDKCLLMFDDEFRTQLNSDLSTLSFLEKRIFLFSMISIDEKKKKSGVNSRVFQYSVKEYGILRSVCKIAFISLHNTTQSMVRNLCYKMIANQLIPIDKRGKHKKQQTIPEPAKELIKTHLFDTLNSPDIFKCAKKCSGMPNINQLWDDFKKKHHYNLPRSTYSRYVHKLLTSDVIMKFMCANEANQILIQLKENGY